MSRDFWNQIRASTSRIMDSETGIRYQRTRKWCWGVTFFNKGAFFSLCVDSVRQLKRPDLDWPDLELSDLERSDMDWPGVAWSGLIWTGATWPGLVWPGLTWPGETWPGATWPGGPWLNWPDLERPDMDWPGVIWPGLIWTGETWPGGTWPGETWPRTAGAIEKRLGLHATTARLYLCLRYVGEGEDVRSSMCYYFTVRTDNMTGYGRPRKRPWVHFYIRYGRKVNMSVRKLIYLERETQFTSGLLCSMPPSHNIFLWDRHRNPPVPDTARGTCWVRGCQTNLTFSKFKWLGRLCLSLVCV